jgi:peptide-methionine (S)-S-oxide reductase
LIFAEGDRIQKSILSVLAKRRLADWRAKSPYFMKNYIFFSVFGLFSLFFLTSAMGCTGSNKPAHTALTDTTTYGKLDTATFAMGCFWCVEAVFESLRGVKEAESGYAGGTKANPTYEEVGAHTTGHTETVQIYYDPKIINYETLIDVYFNCGDPTQVMGQGPDRGEPYRSVIFYRTETERTIAEAYAKKLNASSQYILPVSVDLEPFTKFWLAEGYHQNYERQHPDNSYVRNVSVPRLNKVKRMFPQLLKPGMNLK